MVSLLKITMFVLCVSVAGLHVQEPVLNSLREISSHSPRIYAAAGVGFMRLAIPAAYLLGLILVFLQVAPPALVALVPPPALGRFAGLACAIASAALLFLLTMPLVHALYSCS